MKAVTRVQINKDIIQVELKNVEKNMLFVGDIFKTISSYNVNVDMISQVMLEDEVRIDFTCDADNQVQLNEAIEAVKKSHPRIIVIQSKTVGKVMVEGEAMNDEVGVAARLFELLGQNQIKIYQVTTSDTSISYVTDKDQIEHIKELIEKEYSL